MNNYNSKNERIKRDYFRYQTEARQKSKATLKGIVKAVDRFERYIQLKDFSTFNKEQAIGFKKYLQNQKAIKSQEPLSGSTILSTLNNLKEFFSWLAFQQGYKSKIDMTEIEYFNLSEKEIRQAKSPKLKDFPSLEQIRKVINDMPTNTVINRRDRALLVLTVLTGIRDGALASIRIRHVALNSEPILIKQEPDLVKTKKSKQIFSHFLPVGDDFVEIFKDWMSELKNDLLYSPNDPVFPRTKVKLNEQQILEADGVEPVCWAGAGAIRKIFKSAFESAGLTNFTPHRFRNTLTHQGQEVCTTPEEFKAWSQSLGHNSPLTTFISYGNIDPIRQGKILAKIGSSKKPDLKEEVMRALAELGIKKP